MNIYQVKSGETISDVVMNGSGDISEWFNIIDANDFNDWTPILFADQIINIPNIKNSQIVKELQLEPCYNITLNVTSQINSLISIFDSIVDIPVNNFSIPIQDLAQFYKVRNGETIGDICNNATGDISNWQQILNDNLFTDWSPELTENQTIKITSACKIQQNNIRDLFIEPSNNRLPDNINDQINVLISIFTKNNDYIFSNGGNYEFNLGTGISYDYEFEI
jgi:hypothetical protein